VFEDLIAVGSVVVFTVGGIALLNVAISSRARFMQAWSEMYLFAMLCVVAATFTPFVDSNSVLQVLPNFAVVGTIGGLWNGCRVFNTKRPRLAVFAVFLAVTTVVSYLELPERGEWAGLPVTMGAVALLALASAQESMRGDMAKLIHGRVVAVICWAGAALAIARLLTFAILGPDSDVFEEYFNRTSSAMISLIAFVAVTYTTAVLVAARTGAGSLRSAATPTFSMGVLGWAAFLPGARDRVERVRAHGEESAVLVVHINGLDEINVTYGPTFADETIRTLADFLRVHLYPTTIIGHRGGGRFVLVGIPSDEQETERRALELLDELVGVTVANKKGFRLAVSIGIADSFSEKHSFDALYDAASAACDRARTAGGSRVEASATSGA
jgi:diguanylate cyclase (GGDEF)-like protein